MHASRRWFAVCATMGAAFLLLASSAAPALANNDKDKGEKDGSQHEADEAPRWLGIMFRSLSDDDRQQLDLDGEAGLIVMRVMPNSPADRAGARENDVFLSVGKQPLTEVEQVLDAVREAGKSPLAFRVLRDGEELTLKIRPAARPPHFALPEMGDDGLRDRFGEMFGHRLPQHFRGLRFIPRSFGEADLPDDVQVTIRKRGKQPAEIVVERGEQRWSVGYESLSELPEDVRGPVAALLGRGPVGMTLQIEDGAREKVDDPEHVGPPMPDLGRQLEQVHRQMRHLQEQIDALRHEPAKKNEPLREKKQRAPSKQK